MNLIKFEELNNRIYEEAIKKLTYRDRSIFELKTHLLNKEFNQEEIDDVIFYMENKGYIDDIKYVKQFFNYALSKKWGPNKIIYKLKEKGVSDEKISKGRKEYEDDEIFEKNINDLNEVFYINAKLISIQYFDSFDKIDEKIIGKVGRRLNSLGYESDMIYKVIGEKLE